EVDAETFVPETRLRFKLEQLQHTGTFKARGAFNRIISAAQAGELTDAGVVIASGGNAGLAVAHAARQYGSTAHVYVPETTPAVKVARLAELGADVIRIGQRYADAQEAATSGAQRTGALYCHAYDQPEICAGQGTLGTELFEQSRGELDTVLLAVGGGGLLAGVATALQPSTRVVGVEPRTSPALHSALAFGGPTDVEVSGVATDSLGATRVGDIAWDAADRPGVLSVLVDDDEITAARALLWDKYRVVVEHGTAAPVAALLNGAYRPEPGERITVVLCGANTDITDLA